MEQGYAVFSNPTAGELDMAEERNSTPDAAVFTPVANLPPAENVGARIDPPDPGVAIRAARSTPWSRARKRLLRILAMPLDFLGKSKMFTAVFVCWSLLEMGLSWFFLAAMFRFQYVNYGAAHAYMLILALKTVVFATEVLLALSGDKTLYNKYSLNLASVQNFLIEPGIELPMYAALYHSSYCEFSGPLLRLVISQAKLWISLFHIFVMVVKWLVLLRRWYRGSTPADNRKWTIFLYFLGIFFATFWLISFRLWYFERAYREHEYCYSGKMIKLTPRTEKQFQFLKKLAQSSLGDALFCGLPQGVNQEVRVQIISESWPKWKRMLKENKLHFTVIPFDIQHYIEEEKKLMGRRLKFLNFMDSSLFEFDFYHPLNEIYSFIGQLCRNEYSNLCEIIIIGKSREERPLKVLKISPCLQNLNTSRCSGKRPALWIDAGIHAREWVSTATAVYIINELLSKYKDDAAVRNSVDVIDWYILPVMNPDGYKFSWETHRLYRKNRANSTVVGCRGVDLNRNFDFHWGEPGASSDPCSLTYFGTKPFSEPESRAVADFLIGAKNSSQSLFVAYLTLHSYGQMWMYPYSQRKNTYPPDVADLENVANKAVSALQKINGTKYSIGSGADLMYLSSGSSVDWAKQTAGIKFAYAIELRPTARFCNMGNGFLLPANQIIPNSREIFAAIGVVAEEASKFFYSNSIN